MSVVRRLHEPARLRARITAPALFRIQWDDEIFLRKGQLALFDALGSRDKQLIAYTGKHGETAPGAIAAWCAFMSHHLRPMRFEAVR